METAANDRCLEVWFTLVRVQVKILGLGLWPWSIERSTSSSALETLSVERTCCQVSNWDQISDLNSKFVNNFVYYRHSGSLLPAENLCRSNAAWASRGAHRKARSECSQWTGFEELLGLGHFNTWRLEAVRWPIRRRHRRRRVDKFNWVRTESSAGLSPTPKLDWGHWNRFDCRLGQDEWQCWTFANSSRARNASNQRFLLLYKVSDSRSDLIDSNVLRWLWERWQRRLLGRFWGWNVQEKLGR